MFPTGQSQDLLGQTGMGRPIVPVSRDKKILVPLSLYPTLKTLITVDTDYGHPMKAKIKDF